MAEHAAVRSLADHQSLRERIVARLRQAIITGDLAPKSRLIEPELARQLNVSRTPLREAIRQLRVRPGTFDWWASEIKKTVGRELRRRGLYPPRRYRERTKQEEETT